MQAPFVKYNWCFFLFLKTTHQKSVKDETFCTNYIKLAMYKSLTFDIIFQLQIIVRY